MVLNAFVAEIDCEGSVTAGVDTRGIPMTETTGSAPASPSESPRQVKMFHLKSRGTPKGLSIPCTFLG